MTVVLPTLTCNRCGHAWHPKFPRLPVFCASCNSPYWNSPRTFRVREVKKSALLPEKKQKAAKAPIVVELIDREMVMKRKAESSKK